MKKIQECASYILFLIDIVVCNVICVETTMEMNRGEQNVGKYILLRRKK